MLPFNETGALTLVLHPYLSIGNFVIIPTVNGTFHYHPLLFVKQQTGGGSYSVVSLLSQKNKTMEPKVKILRLDQIEKSKANEYRLFKYVFAGMILSFLMLIAADYKSTAS